MKHAILTLAISLIVFAPRAEAQTPVTLTADNGVVYELNSPKAGEATVAAGVATGATDSFGEPVFTSPSAAVADEIKIAATVTDDDGNEYTVTRIADAAFYGCENLKRVTIPEGVKYLGSYAFKGCTSLVVANIPARATTIGDEVFAECGKLASVDFRCYIYATMGDGVFRNCKSLTSLIIYSALASMGDGVFQGCDKLNTVNVGSEYYFKVQDCALYEMDTIAHVPNRLIFVFPRATGTDRTFTVPYGVTSVGSYAFASCEGVTAVCIPGTVTEIGEAAFGGKSGVTMVNIDSQTPPAVGDILCAQKDFKVGVPQGCKDGYLDAWKGKFYSNLTSLPLFKLRDETLGSIKSSTYDPNSKVETVVVETDTTAWALGLSVFAEDPSEWGNKHTNVTDTKANEITFTTSDVEYGQTCTVTLGYRNVKFKPGNYCKEITNIQWIGANTVSVICVPIEPYGYVVAGGYGSGGGSSAGEFSISSYVNKVTISGIANYGTYTINMKKLATFESADETQGTVSATWIASNAARVDITPAAGYELASATKSGEAYEVTPGATTVYVTDIERVSGWHEEYVFSFRVKESSALGNVASGPASVIGVFDLSGKRVGRMGHGVYIVRYSDGSARKIVK